MFARLLLLFIGVPVLELILFMKIGSRIGLPATLGIIVLTGILGAWLTRVQGLRTLSRFQQAMAEGRMPHAEVMDGLMILVAGAVLLTPGFLTDAIGFLLLFPPFRAQVRAGLGRYLESRVQVVGMGVPPGSPPPGAGQPRQGEVETGTGTGGPKSRPTIGKDPVIIDATIVDEDEGGKR